MPGRGNALVNVAAANMSQLNSMPAHGSNYQFVNGKNRKVYKGTKAGVFYRKTPSGAKAYLKEHEKKALLTHLLKHSVAPPAVIVNNAGAARANAVPLGPFMNSKKEVAVPALPSKTNVNNLNRLFNKNNIVNDKGRKVYKGAKRGALYRLSSSGKKSYLTKANKIILAQYNRLMAPPAARANAVPLNSLPVGNVSTPGFLPPSPSISAILGSSAKRNNATAKAAHNIVARAINRAKNTELMNRLSTPHARLGGVRSAPF